MKAIQQTSPKYPSLLEAQDALEGISRLSGYLLGYVDEKENRVVAFFHDTFPDQPLAAQGQVRREIVYAFERHQRGEDRPGLAVIADAIQNGVDLTKR